MNVRFLRGHEQMINLLREYIAGIIETLEVAPVKTPGERGLLYEAALVEVLEASGDFDVGASAGNNNSVSDIDVTVLPQSENIKVAFEVKLNHKALLGKIRKHNFESLTWNGEKFAGTAKPNSDISDAITSLIASMNSSTAVKNIKALEPYITPYKPLPWDLLATFGRNPGGPDEADLYAVMRNDRKGRFPIPGGAQPAPYKQITSKSESKSDLVITPETIRSVIARKKGSAGSDTCYVIIGDDSGAPTGEIYALGGRDPLNLGAPLYNPGEVSVEMRFQAAGGPRTGRAISFGLDTRGGSPPSGGKQFGGQNPSLAEVLTAGLGAQRLPVPERGAEPPDGVSSARHESFRRRRY